MLKRLLFTLALAAAFPVAHAAPPKASATATPDVSAPSKSAGRTTAAKVNEGQKVNVNTANLAELEMLPGVGPTLAQAIINYREANGMFHTTADLTKVPGIRERRLAKLAPWIIVDDKATQSGRDPGIVNMK